MRIRITLKAVFRSRLQNLRKKALPFYQEILIAIFIWSTLGGLYYTMTHKISPYVAWKFAHYSYGMQGPWQGYTTHNKVIVAYGWIEDPLLEEGGRWEEFDLKPYFPFPITRGETGIRMLIRGFRNAKKYKYEEMAKLFLEREQRKGKPYTAVRLYWEKWPKSDQGWEGLRKEPYIEETFQAQYP